MNKKTRRVNERDCDCEKREMKLHAFLVQKKMAKPDLPASSLMVAWDELHLMLYALKISQRRERGWIRKFFYIFLY
jgi:hypothetical protein